MPATSAQPMAIATDAHAGGEESRQIHLATVDRSASHNRFGGQAVEQCASVQSHSAPKLCIAVARSCYGWARSPAGPISRLRLSAELIKPT